MRYNPAGCIFIAHCLIYSPINTVPILTKIHTLWLPPGLEIRTHRTEWILIGIYTRLAFWMPDFVGVNQIGLNKVTWGIPMVISPSFSLSTSYKPSLHPTLPHLVSSMPVSLGDRLQAVLMWMHKWQPVWWFHSSDLVFLQILHCLILRKNHWRGFQWLRCLFS